MTRVYLDTNILVYAVGDESPFRGPCREILQTVVERRLTGETSAYTLQEFVRQRLRRGDSKATTRARAAMDMCAALHPVDQEILVRAFGLVERDPRLDIADAVHVSTALVHGIATVLSADRGLDGVEGIERVDPLDHARLAALATD